MDDEGASVTRSAQLDDTAIPKNPDTRSDNVAIFSGTCTLKSRIFASKYTTFTL